MNAGNSGLLPAIVPVVVYHGAATWRVSRQFADGVAAPLALRGAGATGRRAGADAEDEAFR